MQKLLLVALALVAIAFAQQLQSPPIAPQTLVNGVTVAKTLQPVAEDRALWTDSFRFWVPENAALVNLTAGNSGPDCSYVTFLIRTSGYPCNPELYDGDLDGDSAVCQLVENPGDSVYYEETEFFQYVPGYHNQLFQFKAGGWWYFGVGRYYQSDNDTACPYNITVSVAQNCSVGSVGVVSGNSDYAPDCVAYTAINSSNINQQQTLTSVTAPWVVYKVQVPATTAEFLTVTVNSTSNDLYLYGGSYSVPNEDDYECYTGSPSSVGSFYIYTLECPAPRSGAFFVLIDNDDSSSWNANVNFVLSVCNNPNLLGEGCQYGSQAFPLFLDGVPIPLDQVQEWTYAYVDFGDYGSNYTSARVTVTYRQGNVGSATLYTRLNGFPTDDAYEASGQVQSVDSSDGAGWLFTPFDLAEAGRLYIGLYCNSVCNYTVTVLASGLSATTNNGETTTTTTTSTSTTASTTTTGTSTGTSSSASTSTSTSEATLSTVSYFVAVCAVVATLLLSY